MAKGHRSQIKRERNEVKDTRPSAKLSYARVSVQKACFVLDAIRGKDVQTALAIVTYNPRYASSLVKKLLESAIANAENNNGMKAENLFNGLHENIDFLEKKIEQYQNDLEASKAEYDKPFAYSKELLKHRKQHRQKQLNKKIRTASSLLIGID